MKVSWYTYFEDKGVALSTVIKKQSTKAQLDFCCLLTSPFEVDKPEVGATRDLENMREMFKLHTCMKKIRRFNTLSALLSYYYLKNTQE